MRSAHAPHSPVLFDVTPLAERSQVLHSIVVSIAVDVIDLEREATPADVVSELATPLTAGTLASVVVAAKDTLSAPLPPSTPSSLTSVNLPVLGAPGGFRQSTAVDAGLQRTTDALPSTLMPTLSVLYSMPRGTSIPRPT